MEDGTTNKRVRHEFEDSELNLPASKRIRVDSFELKHVQDESYDAAVNLIRDDLLEILDDSDAASVTDPAIQGLDSVIKSFEEEILVHPPDISKMTSGSGESQPELGFLLEASNDELGLPQTISDSGDNDRPIGLERLSSDAGVFGEMKGFDDEFPSYHPDWFGIGGEPENGTDNNSGEYVTLGGLFDYEPSDYWEFSYESESFPAI